MERVLGIQDKLNYNTNNTYYNNVNTNNFSRSLITIEAREYYMLLDKYTYPKGSVVVDHDNEGNPIYRAPSSTSIIDWRISIEQRALLLDKCRMTNVLYRTPQMKKVEQEFKQLKDLDEQINEVKRQRQHEADLKFKKSLTPFRLLFELPFIIFGLLTLGITLYGIVTLSL